MFLLVGLLSEHSKSFIEQDEFLNSYLASYLVMLWTHGLQLVAG
jgi:hypothetical protein